MATKIKQATILTVTQLNRLRSSLPYTEKPLKIKNGNIVLPRNLRSQWKNAEVEIREYDNDRIVLERSTPENRQQRVEAFKRAAGILKGKIPDPVAWQRKIRKEWDRKLPRLHVHD